MTEIGTSEGFCASTITIWQAIGYVLLIVKIVIPMVLISSLIKKFIIAVVIFFLPTIMSSIYPLITGFNQVKSDYDVCMECVTKPKGIECMKRVEEFNENNG